MIDVIHALNRELGDRVAPGQLAAADAVLRAAIGDDELGRERSARVVHPPI